jgi:hypothetical protein
LKLRVVPSKSAYRRSSLSCTEKSIIDRNRQSIGRIGIPFLKHQGLFFGGEEVRGKTVRPRHRRRNREGGLFEPEEGPVNDRIDDAYRAKYRGSPYLDPMIGKPARSATVRIMPQVSNS